MWPSASSAPPDWRRRRLIRRPWQELLSSRGDAAGAGHHPPDPTGEDDAAGELIGEAYRTLGNFWVGFYEQQLRDVAARTSSGEVLVAEIAARSECSVCR